MSASAGAPWQRGLVLGGIRSGKSELAEALVADAAEVRYVATARRGDDDADWAARIDAHRERRPGHWATVEVGASPLALPDLLASAPADEHLLVDDLGGWVAALMETVTPARWPDQWVALSRAIAASAARIVIVSPEVGLSVVPHTAAGRAFADTLGSTNRAVAAACDVVVLVIAGNAVPVKGRL